MNDNWDFETDVLIIGSGAGGMLAAAVAADNHAEVLLVEKEAEWGGTSATSGAGIWIPKSDQAAAAGFDDDVEDAFQYVRALSADNVPDEQIRAYVENAAPMLRWIGEHTPIEYHAFPYPDYHAENPGGSPTGFRTHMPSPIDGRKLGKDVETLRFASPAASLFGYLNWHFDETHIILFRAKGWATHMAKSLARYWLDLPFRLKSRKDRRLTLGNALAGGLRLKLNELGVSLWLESPMLDLIKDDSGAVIGAVVERAGKKLRVRARKGVVLAAGGFDKNAEMRAEHAPLYPSAQRSGGTSGNTGDSIRAGIKLGAKTRNMHSAWAAPVFYVPEEDRGRLCTIERALPGCIMVNQDGKRYLNEAASYHIVGQEMARAAQESRTGNQASRIDENGGPIGDDASWVIFDHEFRHKFPMGPLLPLVPDWAQSKGVRQILKKGATLESLARDIGLDPQALEATVARFNEYAAKGEDPDFHRGEATYDKMYGDPRHGPNPSLKPITKGPFYAMPLYPGDIGTNGGLVTDGKARVIGEDGRPIGGLYAIGNSAASAMGESYPGAGVTIGPALTFGYLAARDITGVN